MERIAIIAGSGMFPILMAREYNKQGFDPLIVAVAEEADKSIEDEASIVLWQPLGKVGKLLKSLEKEKINRVVLAGKVHKTRIFRDFKPDIKALTLLWGLRDRKDDTIMLKVADILKDEGIELLPQTTHMESYLPKAQIFTRKKPTSEEQNDIEFGTAMAREIGRIDVGQTVVVKRGAVLALEAIEGTDQAILRGGSLGNGGAVVVKTAKPGQDPRFDVPAIGIETVTTCLDAGISVLAIESKKTFFLQKEESIELANKNALSIVAF